MVPVLAGTILPGCSKENNGTVPTDPMVAPREISIPTIDLSKQSERQVVIEPGTPEIR